MIEEWQEKLRRAFSEHEGAQRLPYLPVIKCLERFPYGRTEAEIAGSHAIPDISTRLQHMQHGGLLETRTTSGVTYFSLTETGRAYGENRPLTEPVTIPVRAALSSMEP